MDQLRATFIAGPVPNIHAQEVFTDRTDEQEAFVRSIQAIANETIKESAALPTVDMARGRKNVLVYYGIGGIGKTSLSKRLEHRFIENLISDLPDEGARSVCRINLADAGGFDLEAVLMQMRFELSTIARNWPAFDLAFALYWSKAHPGETLKEYFKSHSAMRKTSKQLAFLDQLEDTIKTVFEEIGMQWAPTKIALHLTTLTHDVLMRSMRFRRTRRECPIFEPIIESDDPVEALSYMPSLLGWQLDRIKIEKQAQFVVFVDHFESITSESNRDAERILQRLVYLMPLALFVITSRHRLDWGNPSETGEMDYMGPWRWPLLGQVLNGDNEPRQHLLGSLSTGDCDEYLATVIRDSEGHPAIPEEIRNAIVRGSNGHPLYLDLSVTLFLELSSRSQTVSADAFGQPLPSVVARIMRDLNRDERNLMRTVSLLDSFDVNFAVAASASPYAVVKRFCQSALVFRDDSEWPYTLHSELRESIRLVDSRMDDSWSQQEWRSAADRVCAYLEGCYRSASQRRDRTAIGRALRQALRVSALYDFVPPWIMGAAQDLADMGAWSALDVQLPPDTQRSSPARSVATALHGIALRRTGSLVKSADMFTSALQSTTLDDQTMRVVMLHRAHSVRNSGNYASALDEYHELATGDDEVAMRAQIQIADISLLLGEFRTADRSLDILARSARLDAAGEVERIRGHVYRFNGQFSQAESHYARALTLATEISSPALEAKAYTNMAETLCWTDRDRANWFADRAIDVNSEIGNQLEVLKASVAKAISSPGLGAVELLDTATNIARKSGYKAGHAFASLAGCFLFLLDNDVVSAKDAARRIEAIAQEIGVYQFLSDIAAWWIQSYEPDWIGHGVRPHEWLDSEAEAKQYWTQVLEERRAGR